VRREVQDSIEIARPVEQVFTYVTNPAHWAQWSGPVIDVRWQQPGQLTPDAIFTVVAKLVGRQFETQSQVTEFEPNRLLAYHSTSGPVPSTFTWRFEASGTGTRLTQTVSTDDEQVGTFFRLGFALIEAAYRRQMTADLTTLKEVLESQDRDDA
jgi:uncharacterized protein YndB with AHSA1/START domain